MRRRQHSPTRLQQGLPRASKQGHTPAHGAARRKRRELDMRRRHQQTPALALAQTAAHHKEESLWWQVGPSHVCGRGGRRGARLQRARQRGQGPDGRGACRQALGRLALAPSLDRRVARQPLLAQPAGLRVRPSVVPRVAVVQPRLACRADPTDLETRPVFVTCFTHRPRARNIAEEGGVQSTAG